MGFDHPIEPSRLQIPRRAVHELPTKCSAKRLVPLLVVVVLKEVDRDTHHPVLDVGPAHGDSKVTRCVTPNEFGLESLDFELEPIALFKDDFKRRSFGHVRRISRHDSGVKALHEILSAIGRFNEFGGTVEARLPSTKLTADI